MITSLFDLKYEILYLLNLISVVTEMNKIIAPSKNYLQTLQHETIMLEEIEENMHLIDCDIDCRFGRKQLQEAQFENCRFLLNDYSQMEFLDITFKKCDLSNFDFTKSIFYRCHFHSCKLIGSQFIHSKLKDVYWQDCLMNYAIFSESTFKHVCFKDCQLEEAFFQNVHLDQVDFLKCQLQMADFTESKLNGIDFSTSDFIDIKLTPSLADGMAIRYDQAAAIAAMLGVIIKD